jgi:predicted transcriptional regulator
MNTLTLKIPDSLNNALQLASARRNMTKSAVVREALEKVLADELKQTTPAASWLVQWRGALSEPVSSQAVKAAGGAAAGDARVADILNKHLC